MKITEILAWRVDLPFKDGRYTWSDGRFIEVAETTVVEVKTNAGISGFGEICPLGTAYLPAYATGVRTGIAEIAPHLIGKDPGNLNAINDSMNRALLGHPYVKSPLDIACWDILGKVSGLPVYALLGGAMQDNYLLYRAITQGSPESMAKTIKGYHEEGYRKFQLKVGGNADDDIERILATRAILNAEDILVADANRGWTQHEATRVVDAIANEDVYIEQPCNTYKECLSIRQRTTKPLILDESMQTVHDIVQGISEDAMDIISLKISKFGGLTNSRLIRDVCITSGIPMTIEDVWGGDIVTAAVTHLARSAPKNFCFSSTDLNSYNTVSTAKGVPPRVNGRITASDRPGLGIEPDFDTLGDPVFRIRA